MWLGRVLFGARSFPGRMWTGKNRKVRKISGHMKRNKEKREALVQHVEQMIAVPYLTQEEDMGHAKEKKEKQLSEMIRRNKSKLKPDVLGLNSEHAPEGYENFLEHLNVSKKWTPKD